MRTLFLVQVHLVWSHSVAWDRAKCVRQEQVKDQQLVLPAARRIDSSLFIQEDEIVQFCSVSSLMSLLIFITSRKTIIIIINVIILFVVCQ